MNFQKLELNNRLKLSISELVDSGKLPHAIVIEGGSEDTRVKLARLLAASLVCTSSKNRPCTLCPACVNVFGGRSGSKKFAGEKLLAQKIQHPDISEFEKEKNRKQFSIKIVRDHIRKEAYIIPNGAGAKVFILLESHLMTTQAQNALLKILEEPPSYLCFILECTSKSLLLPTVLSRATCFSLGQLELGDGVRAKKMELAAQTAEEIALAITAPHEYELLKKTAVFEKNKNLLALCLPELELIVRDALVLQAAGKETFSAPSKAAEILAKDLSQVRLFKLIKEIRLLYEATLRNANNNLLITLTCSRLRV